MAKESGKREETRLLFLKATVGSEIPLQYLERGQPIPSKLYTKVFNDRHVTQMMVTSLSPCEKILTTRKMGLSLADDAKSPRLPGNRQLNQSINRERSATAPKHPQADPHRTGCVIRPSTGLANNKIK